jgi:hypothetical protein
MTSMQYRLHIQEEIFKHQYYNYLRGYILSVGSTKCGNCYIDVCNHSYQLNEVLWNVHLVGLA